MRCIPIYRVLVAIGLLACVVYSNPIGRVPSVRVPSVRVPSVRVPSVRVPSVRGPHAVVPPVGPGIKPPNYSPKETEEKKKACGCGRKRWEGCLGHNSHGLKVFHVPGDDGHHHRRDDAPPKAEADVEKSKVKPEENNKKGKEYPKITTVEEIREQFKKNRELKDPQHEKRFERAFPRAHADNEKGEVKPEENRKKGKDYPKVRTVEEIREHFRKNRELKELPHEKRFQRSFPRGLYPKGQEHVPRRPGELTFEEQQDLRAAIERIVRGSRFWPVRKKGSHEKVPHKTGSFPRGLYPEWQEHVTPRYGKLSYDEQQALHAVNVTIEQNGKDPVAINIIVRNNSKMNVTIMARNSVIDKDSFRLGYFHVSPDDTKINFAPQREEAEWYHTPMGKYTKPGAKKYHKKYLVDDLVHIKAGETVQQTIPIPGGTKEEQEQWFKMIRHGKKIKLYVEGKWFGIGAWKGEQPHWSKDLDYGFKSNTIEVQLPPA